MAMSIPAMPTRRIDPAYSEYYGPIEPRLKELLLSKKSGAGSGERLFAARTPLQRGAVRHDR